MRHPFSFRTHPGWVRKKLAKAFHGQVGTKNRPVFASLHGLSHWHNFQTVDPSEQTSQRGCGVEFPPQWAGSPGREGGDPAGSRTNSDRAGRGQAGGDLSIRGIGPAILAVGVGGNPSAVLFARLRINRAGQTLRLLKACWSGDATVVAGAIAVAVRVFLADLAVTIDLRDLSAWVLESALIHPAIPSLSRPAELWPALGDVHLEGIRKGRNRLHRGGLPDKRQANRHRRLLADQPRQVLIGKALQPPGPLQRCRVESILLYRCLCDPGFDCHFFTARKCRVCLYAYKGKIGARGHGWACLWRKTPQMRDLV